MSFNTQNKVSFFMNLINQNNSTSFVPVIKVDEVNDKKIILANNASYFLQRAKNFMANATELHFPSDSPHIWVTGK